MFTGSSPRVRGKLRGGPGAQHGARIIPARAGQTQFGVMTDSGPSDHPRACGANPWSSAMGTPVSGSSPRVRGKPISGVRPDGHLRIIPARAGQTSMSNG